MDLRAAKRRKVSNDAADVTKAQSSPVPQRTKDLPGSRSSPAVGRKPVSTTESNLKEGILLWQEAKAKRLAERHGKKRIDVYDDFDGAQGKVGGESEKQRRAKSDGTQVKRKPTNSQMEATFDPLRNQKSSHGVSPQKSSTSLDFFKQFGKKARAANAVTNGVEGTPEKSKAIHANKEAEEGAADELATDEPSSRPVKKKSNIKPSWHYEAAANSETTADSTPQRKTFEDEIRELEETARRQAEAEADESQEEETPESTARRTSGRQPVPRREHPMEQKLLSRTVSRALDRRKAPANREREIVPEVGGERKEHSVEIDDSEEERLRAAKHIAQPQLKPRENTIPKRPKPQPVARAAPIPTVAVPVALISTVPFPDLVFQPSHLRCIQSVLLERATRKRPMRLLNLEEEYAKVFALVQQTVVAGESNSMLLIGARGSGKSTLVDQILRKQNDEHPDDFHVVRLSGFIHTDDKIALREIWRQLGREMDIGEEESTSKNYADTLTTLLALLSHPAENGTHQPDQVTKSVIFIIDEFELFASHPRQTLLYNLFDIAQSRKAPIAVLGLTTRIDVVESLEKRVKSRFSHRYVHLSLAKSFHTFEQTCKSAMMLDSSEEYEAMNSTSGSETNIPVEAWNALVNHLMTTEALSSSLRRLYHTTKSVPDFLTSLILPAATLPIDAAISSRDLFSHLTSAFSSSSSFSASSSLSPPDSKLSLLSTLSTLQLALLICAARLTAIYNTDLISLNLAYEEYKLLASKAKIQASAAGALAQGAGGRVWSKAVAKGAWEGLLECELVMEDGRAGGGGGGGRVDVGLEEIGASGVELGQWGRWCREI